MEVEVNWDELIYKLKKKIDSSYYGLSAEDREDILQEALIYLYKRADVDSNFSFNNTYLSYVLKYAARDYLKSQNNHPLEFEEYLLYPQRLIEDTNTIDKIEDILALPTFPELALSNNQKNLIMLRLEGYTSEDIAKMDRKSKMYISKQLSCINSQVKLILFLHFHPSNSDFIDKVSKNWRSRELNTIFNLLKRYNSLREVLNDDADRYFEKAFFYLSKYQTNREGVFLIKGYNYFLLGMHIKQELSEESFIQFKTEFAKNRLIDEALNGATHHLRKGSVVDLEKGRLLELEDKDFYLKAILAYFNCLSKNELVRFLEKPDIFTPAYKNLEIPIKAFYWRSCLEFYRNSHNLNEINFLRFYNYIIALIEKELFDKLKKDKKIYYCVLFLTKRIRAHTVDRRVKELAEKILDLNWGIGKF